MATTSNFGWETPDDTDYVYQGAQAMRLLGDSIDTSMAELKGGTTGQVLSKTSSTDMDFTWATPSNYVPTGWTPISTTSISSAMGTTFSGLSGYASYKLVWWFANSTYDYLTINCNGNTGNNWYFVGAGVSGSTPFGTDCLTTPISVVGGFPANYTSGENATGSFLIDGCNKTSSMEFRGQGFGQNGSHQPLMRTFEGVFAAGATISSITFTLTSSLISLGVVRLYGKATA